MPSDCQCEHNYTFLRSSKTTDHEAIYNTHFIRVDTFYCTKCLDYKTITKESYARDTPIWFNGV